VHATVGLNISWDTLSAGFPHPWRWVPLPLITDHARCQHPNRSASELVKASRQRKCAPDVAQVTVNVPLTKSTRGMIDASAISKMKKGAYLVRRTTAASLWGVAAVTCCETSTP
jgi:D-isomer specific 2-hydroxyacid dehydrogenase, NAD binding domain